MNRKESLDTLGLENGATDEEIKKKYRKLAKKSHPDLNKDNVNATNDFIKLKEAYNTLLDSKHVDPLISSRFDARNQEFNSYFEHFIQEINEFFSPRYYRSQDIEISNPEPFVDLRRIVRERKRKKDLVIFHS
jgi:DnaJ-class molecular chaperone